jgi:hypothetical protein
MQGSPIVKKSGSKFSSRTVQLRLNQIGIGLKRLFFACFTNVQAGHRRTLNSRMYRRETCPAWITRLDHVAAGRQQRRFALPPILQMHDHAGHVRAAIADKAQAPRRKVGSNRLA